MAPNGVAPNGDEAAAGAGVPKGLGVCWAVLKAGWLAAAPNAGAGVVPKADVDAAPNAEGVPKADAEAGAGEAAPKGLPKVGACARTPSKVLIWHFAHPRKLSICVRWQLWLRNSPRTPWRPARPVNERPSPRSALPDPCCVASVGLLCCLAALCSEGGSDLRLGAPGSIRVCAGCQVTRARGSVLAGLCSTRYRCHQQVTRSTLSLY